MYKGSLYFQPKKNELFQQKSLTFWPYHLHQLWSPPQKYGSFMGFHDPLVYPTWPNIQGLLKWFSSWGGGLVREASDWKSKLLGKWSTAKPGWLWDFWKFWTNHRVDVVDVYISYWKLGWFFQLYIHVGFFGGKYISIYHFRHLHKTDRSSWKKTGMPFL